MGIAVGTNYATSLIKQENKIMPGLDGTGPLGYGSGTGRGLGPCGGGMAWGRGRGLGWRRFYGRLPFTGKITSKEESGMLKNEAEAIEEELKAIKDRLKELKN